MPQSKDLVVADEQIISKIYLVRGQKVMLDKDLALLYGVAPIRLREQVKRNGDRFPESFAFRLSKEEAESMVSQNAIPSRKHLGGSLPMVFTEHGVLMLANVLKSKLAIAASIRIVDIFVRMRSLLLTHKDILLQMEKIEHRLMKHDEELQTLFQYLKELLKTEETPRIVIEGLHGKRKGTE